MKVLLVEDNLVDARMVRELLKNSRSVTFELQHVTRLDAALDCLRRETFDVVLLDLGLPDSQATQTLALTKMAHSGLTILVLTVLHDESIALEALRSGVQDYLVKGQFNGELLIRAILYAVERKRAEEEGRRLETELARGAVERTVQLQTANVSLQDSRRVALNLMDDALAAQQRAEQVSIELRQQVAVRKQAEEDLRRSEQRYRMIFDRNPDGVFALNRLGRFLLANPACEAISGYSTAELLQKTFMELCTPDRLAEAVDSFERTLRGTGPLELETSLLHKDGRRVEIWVAGEPLTTARETVVHCTVKDISKRKRAEENLRQLNRTLKAHSHSDRAMMRVQEESAYLNEVCEIVVRDCGHAMVWIGYAENDEAKTVRPVACAGFEEGYLETLKVTWADTERGRGPTGTAIRTGKPSLGRNLLTDPEFAPWREEARRRGYTCSVVLPLLADGRAFGALNIYSREPDPFTQEEVELLNKLAEDLAHGITALRLRKAHQRAEEKLRRSQDRLLLAQQAGHVGVFDLDFSAQRSLWTDERKAIFGLPPSFEPTWDSWSTFVQSEDRAAVMAELQRAFAARRREVEQTYRIRQPDGQERWLRDRAVITYDSDGRPVRMVGTSNDITREKQEEERSHQRDRQFQHSAVRIMITLAWAIFVAECSVMAGLAVLPPFDPWLSALLDGATMVLLISPLLYYFAFRPLVKTLKQHAAVEEALRRSNEGLESRVKDRTASLEIANQKLEHQIAERNRIGGELERASAEAQERAGELQAVFDALQNPLVVFDPAGKPIKANAAARTLLGEDPTTLDATGYEARTQDWRLRRPDGRLIAPGELPSRRALRGEKVRSEQCRSTGPDGSEMSIETSAVPLMAGERVAGAVVVWQDITERQRGEEALRRGRDELELRVQERTADLQEANDQLRHEIEIRRQREAEIAVAELRYRTVAEFTYDWEYWITPEDALLYCSPSCERISGYTPEELAGDLSLLTRMVHPDDQAYWRQHTCDALHQPGAKTILFRILTKTGEVRWVEHICQPVTDTGGKSLGVRASNRDITDRKLAEMETQHLRQELSRISRITIAGQLAGALAHELNQPLGAVVCNVQAAQNYLSQTSPPLDELREILKDIEADGKRAGGVIHRLRALYQRTGRERTNLQLNNLIQETTDLLHSEFVLKSVTVRLELEATLPPVLGNYVELQQVVINLLVNALDAMSTRECELRCLQLATFTHASNAVRFSVRDSGVGIPPERLSKLFEPFVTTKRGGMGMGLAICQSIVEAHGGRLWGLNNPEGGATFHLELASCLEGSL
jgi:PAS domain S-box-containing protein